MDPAERRRQEAALADRLVDLPGFAAAPSVLLYASAFPEEIATAPMLRRALDLGKVLICPRVDRRARQLRLYRISDPDRDLRPGALGIPEPASTSTEVDPEAIAWVLAPGLAFDPRGYRLGRGGGYYDKLLAGLPPEVPRWALALEPQWVEDLPVEPHDQRLHGIASMERLITALGGKSETKRLT